MNNEDTSNIATASQVLEQEKLRLEFERLRFDRSKLAIDAKLKRREFDSYSKKSLKETVSNPLLLAIVGGFLTLLTSIVTNYLTAAENRDADDRRLQSELLKEFLKTADPKIARDNLTFLIEVGLIPDYERRIKGFLSNNTKPVPRISDAESPPESYPSCPTIDVLSGSNPQLPNTSVGVSIHLGTNRLNPNSYEGWDGQLFGAVPDAKSMQLLASSLGYHPSILTDALARSDCLLTGLNKLSAKLRQGDTLLLTMSGHGGHEIGSGRAGRTQETWVLFDKQLRADDLYDAFAKFKSGVTIIVVQDSSHAAAFRRSTGKTQLSANLIVIAGSKTTEIAMDGEKQGAFTEALLKTWNNGKFSGNYESFVDAIRKKMPVTQTPQLYTYITDAKVLSRKPFSLGN
jgi:Caspase domain